MAKIRKVNERNICLTTVRGQKKYLVCITLQNKKRKKKYFNLKTEAHEWLSNYKKSIDKNLSDFSLMSLAQISDIRSAIAALPHNVSLLDCVKYYSKNRIIANVSLNDAINEFLNLKDGIVSAHYFADIKNQLYKFSKSFSDWNNVTPSEIVKWCKSISQATKTQRHYFGTLREFFDFATTKSYCANPFEKIHKTEIPKLQRTEIKVPSPDKIAIFFKRLESKYPNIVGIYALVAFGGIRLSEAQRLNKESFNYNRKEIILPFKDSKTHQNWLQTSMPDNLWDWLSAYPINDSWKLANPDIYAKNAKKDLDFPQNALRHSFATYHLSLFRDAARTQLLMRHTSSAMLWQTYLAGLVSEEAAKKYFNIRPTPQSIPAAEAVL